MTLKATPTRATLAAIGLTVLTLGATAAIADRHAGGHGGPGRAAMPVFDFTAIDTNTDGKLTTEEIEAHRAAEVAGVDANKDGLLSAAELAAVHLERATARATAHANRMIERHDADADGQLSAAELASRPVPAGMFDRIDADGDGALTQAEVDGARERLSEMRGKRGRRGGPDEN